jgi:hypothetical protein
MQLCAPCQPLRPFQGRGCGAGPRALQRARPRWQRAWRRRARPPPPLQTAASPRRAALTWTRRRRRCRAGGRSPCQHRLPAHRAVACQHRLLAHRALARGAFPRESRERSHSALRPTALCCAARCGARVAAAGACAAAHRPPAGRLTPLGAQQARGTRGCALSAAPLLQPSGLRLSLLCLLLLPQALFGLWAPGQGGHGARGAGAVSACLLSIVHCTGSAQGGWALHSIAFAGLLM